MKKLVLVLVLVSSLSIGAESISANAAEANQPKYSIGVRAYEGMGEGTVINCSSLTVHSSTALSSSAVGWLQKGNTVMVEHSNETDENRSWYCVSYTNSSGKFIRGFVKKSYIKMI